MIKMVESFALMQPLCRLQGIDLGWDQASIQPAAPPAAPPPLTSESAVDDDVDGEAEANDEAALARLVPVLGDLSEGYSGADIKMLCRDAAMAPMRRAIAGKSPDDIRRMKESGEVRIQPARFCARDYALSTGRTL